MYSFKKFITETVENYDKITDPKRKEELINYHNDMSKDHAAKRAEHLKVKPGEKRSLEHSIAAEAHRDAGQLHSFTASALEMNLEGPNDFKSRAMAMTKGANSRSEIANKE